ncbi:MAG: response regulator [Candidatus Limnocylindria bacterium]
MARPASVPLRPPTRRERPALAAKLRQASLPARLHRRYRLIAEVREGRSVPQAASRAGLHPQCGDAAFETELRRSIRMLAERTPAPDVQLRAAVPAIGARVLVVEDDTATRQVVAEALSDEGFTVIPAHDGSHALRLAAASHPHVILLDLGLPVLDGPAFAARWRQRPDSAGVPIVVISGRPDGREAAKAMAALAFFGKPLDLPTLSSTVRSLAHEGPHPRVA